MKISEFITSCGQLCEILGQHPEAAVVRHVEVQSVVAGSKVPRISSERADVTRAQAVAEWFIAEGLVHGVTDDTKKERTA